MHTNLLDAIGNTPLIRVNLNTPGTLYGKLEYLNPGGSVKDRSAHYMIEHAEKNGLLKPGGTIIDASSGNHGTAIAMIGAVKGYKVIIAVSEKISKEKMDTMRAYNAHVIICPPTDFLEDPRSYHSVAKRLQKETPNSFMPDQYFNPINAQGHYHSLGPEIWRQTEGKITHFFAAAGTGGTISGAGKYLKEQNPNITVVGFDCATSWRATGGHPKPYKIEGIGIDFESGAIDYKIIDHIVNVSDEDSIAMLKKLVKEQGILVGSSSGAVAHGTYTFARDHLKEGDIGVMIFGDSGRAYLTKDFYR